MKMSEILDISKYYLPNLINLYIWLYIYKNNKLSGLNKVIVNYFLIFLFIILSLNFMMNISNNSPLVFLIFGGFLSIYEVYFIVNIFSSLFNWRYRWTTIILFSLLICFGPPIALNTLSYQPVNTIDFLKLCFLLFLCLIIIKNYLPRYVLINKIEGFFILVGLILYFTLNLLESIMLVYDISRYWWISELTTIIAYLFWLGSAIYILKVKS